MKYQAVGTVKMRNGTIVPILEIQMMNDKRWCELARENAVHNYRRMNGREPENVDDAVVWQREMLAKKKEIE